MTKKSRFWVVSIRIEDAKMVIFSNFGGLAGDFYKDTHEAKLFGAHIGSVLSGLDAGLDYEPHCDNSRTHCPRTTRPL
jgi:hypothetical protein